MASSPSPDLSLPPTAAMVPLEVAEPGSDGGWQGFVIGSTAFSSTPPTAA